MCEQCIWTDEFYSSSVISPKANDLSGKRQFSINTRTFVAFREVGQGYEGLQKSGTLMNMSGSLSKSSYNDINKKLNSSYADMTVLKRVWTMLHKKSGDIVNPNADTNNLVDSDICYVPGRKEDITH